MSDGAAPGVLARATAQGHEQVVFCSHPPSGLRAIVALHSTALGPALGGTRFLPYPDEDAALADVLALSRGMTYKNALAGLDHGGGKAVILGDPRQLRSEALLRAYGRFVASLGGRYVTACDVGTTVADMDVVSRECAWVTGRSPAAGGAGDSGILTALGVFSAMRAGAQHLWGDPSLAGRRVGVSGLGKVGRRLVTHLVADGAAVTVTDVDERAVAAVCRAHPGVTVVSSTEEMLAARLDVFSPNALGGVLDEQVARSLRAALVCGGANNQLAGPRSARLLHEGGVLYLPDYLVNAGGVVQVADELHGFQEERARAGALRIGATVTAVLDLAREEGILPLEAADRLAEQRIAAVGAVRGLLVPARDGR